MTTPGGPEAHQTASTSTGRLEAFSDGVIAIAITLLILEVSVPEAAPGRLLHELLHQWPSYAAYLVSFLTIGTMWVNHHSMFSRIVRVDRNLLFLNLVLLMGIAFLPFPTALLADYVRDGGSNSHVAAAAYGITMVCIGLSFTALWARLANHEELLEPGYTTVRARATARRSFFGGTLVYVAAIGVALVSAPAALAVYGLVALYFAVSHAAQGA
jgi:uncharacterized membrane protein